MAWPIPEEIPVTNATLCSAMFFSSSLISGFLVGQTVRQDGHLFVEQARNDANVGALELAQRTGGEIVSEMGYASIIFVDSDAQRSIEARCRIFIVHAVGEHR